MTEKAAGGDVSSAHAREDSDPPTTQDTAAGESGPAADRAAATSGATSPTDDAHPGTADGPTPDAEGDRAPSALTNGALGRSDAAAPGSSAADTGSVAPAPDRSEGYGDPVSSSTPVVPSSLRPEPWPSPVAAGPATELTAAETASETTVPSDPLDPPGAADEAASGATAAVGATGAESAPQDRLGRPGRPVLAFAAIAGVVLMAAPFAVNETSQRLPGTTVALVDQEGILGYFMRSDSDGNGEAGAMAEQQSPSSLSASGLMTGVEEQPAPNDGYVPEVLSQEEPEEGGPGDSGDPDSSGSSGSGSGASPDGESSDSSDNEGSEVAVGSDTSGNDLFSGSGGDDDEEDDEENEDVSALGNGQGEDTRGSGSDGESGSPGGSEDDGDVPLGDLPDHNTNGPLTMAATQDSEEGTGTLAADDDGDGESAPEDTSAVLSGGAPATEREEPAEEITYGQRPASVGEPLNTDNGNLLFKATPPEAPEGWAQERTEEHEVQEPATPQNGEDVDEDPDAPEQEEPSTVERLPAEELPPPPEFRYAEVAGVGCAPNERIAYGTAGEFWEGDGTHSWAFGFEGGFAKEKCDGRWHAIPVSGDPDAPNGRYAFWTFNIGFTDAQCEIYVHIPDAESPRWVGGTPAQYQLHPSADPATSEPFASFTVDQVADKGGWVHVGAYTPPGDTISVKLQNSGSDQIDGQDTNAHVVASAVRTRCN